MIVFRGFDVLCYYYSDTEFCAPHCIVHSTMFSEVLVYFVTSHVKFNDCYVLVHVWIPNLSECVGLNVSLVTQ